MSTKRQKAQDFIIEYIDKILPGSENKQYYQDMFFKMTDEQFHQFMIDLKDKTKHLCLIAPNGAKPDLSTQRNLDLAKELNYDFFQRIWIGASGDRPAYLTPIPYMVVKLPLRRQAQLLVKKISIPEDNKSVDDLTGQPTGKSKGAKISYPEAQVLAAMGLDQNMTEMIKFRGGDLKGFDAMNTMISRTGGVSIKAIAPYASGVESTKTMKTILTAMHIKSTL